MYESADQGNHVTALSPALTANDGLGHVALVYGGRAGTSANANLIYVGAGNRIYRRTGPPRTPLTRLAGYPGKLPVNGVAVDQTDYTDVYAVDSSHLYHSLNSGATWTDVTDNLATFNAGNFECIEFFANSVIVGTHAGVFQAVNFESEEPWSQLGSGLPNAPVYRLSYNPAAKVLVAATIGRCLGVQAARATLTWSPRRVRPKL